MVWSLIVSRNFASVLLQQDNRLDQPGSGSLTYLYFEMEEAANASISEPLDLVKLALGERVFIKLRGDRTVSGVLHAYDAHMNLVLSQVEEAVHIVDVTEDGQAMPLRVDRRQMEMLFVRGDGVILISPQQQ
ncbi:hypothetical protein BD324DRAFT_647989 [Kockovaella imperatae]|uniref:LSM complex subunit LSM3 n=1 Tax=Kockovaella imperatae TaxID=4999 RepID=A0A1Y1USU9_9TREE|nr:hypothetical protein BD324DRAFT_647989 [Kockovaella imperatae]ORX41093.1 hypothetical protein BD324DRAFT_647989 [Kockovaella imperatae]